MLLNIADVFTTEGKLLTWQGKWEKDEFLYQSQLYKVTEKEPICLTFSNIKPGKVLLEGNGKFTLLMECGRCLTEVEHTFSLSFSEELIAGTEDKETDSFMEGYHLNVESLISDEILLNWPAKILCKQDCKGICQQCGKNLNLETCSCDDFIPDPRMAAIKDIFNGNKEV